MTKLRPTPAIARIMLHASTALATAVLLSAAAGGAALAQTAQPGAAPASSWSPIGTPTATAAAPQGAAQSAAPNAQPSAVQNTPIINAQIAQTGPVAGAPGAPGAVTTLAAPVAIPEVTVTGSQIKGNPDVLSANPVTVITAEQLQNSNTVTLEQFFQKIPSFGDQGTNQNTNNGGNGVSFVELRNLGITRTLVLVDGKRFVSSSNQTQNAVDFNNIPVSLIDHIEILRDGAAPIYGSDAIAGVINIILKQHFDGLLTTGEIGTSERGDRTTYDVNTTAGLNSDRAGIVFNLGYNHQDPIFQRDVNWARNRLLPDGTNSLASSRIPGGRIQNGNPGAGYVDPFTGASTINDIALGNGQFRRYNGARDFYSLAQEQFLVGASERKSANALMHYDITPDISAYGSFLFTDRQSEERLNPEAEGGDISTPKNPGGLVVPATNPFNPFGVDVVVRTRRFELGDRKYFAESPTYRAQGGFRGTLFDKFDWDVSYTYGKSTSRFNVENEVNQTRLLQVSGALPCGADVASGCAQGNLFGPGALSPALARYIGFNNTSTSEVTQDYFSGNLSGPIIDLPAGPLAFAIGGEHRTESGFYRPDNVVSNGDGSFFTNFTNGAYNVSEGFFELNAPILKDLDFAKELSIDGAMRYSNYSNFGNAVTWKGSVNYAPTEDFRFRGSRATGFRAPAITDLYLGQFQNFVTADDPCDVNVGVRNSNAIAAANCNAVIARQGANPATFLETQNQVNTLQGGNPKLQPEESQQWSIGAVITPRVIPNLSISVDYYKITLRNQITNTDTQTILNNCYTSVNFSSPLCGAIQPRTVGAVPGQLTSVNSLNINAGYVKTDGVDVDLNYSFDLDQLGVPGGGKFAIDNQDTILLNYVEQLPDGTIRRDDGTIISNPAPAGYHRFKASATGTYSQPDWSLAWTTQFISSAKINSGPGGDNPSQYNRTDINGNPLKTPGVGVPNVIYHHIVGTYTWDNVTFIAGVDNLFNKTPPYFNDVATNSVSQDYDYVGRFFYFKTAIKF